MPGSRRLRGTCRGGSPVAADDLADYAEAEDLRASNRRLARQLAQTKAKNVALVDAVYQAAHDAFGLAGRAKIAKPKTDKRTKATEVALVHATDWQGGKKTESFDLDVLHQRIMRLADKVCQAHDPLV